jgi:3-hydroxyisobutyrate dehydrogenase-like beta-hydroxyacid dehydrogenase
MNTIGLFGVGRIGALFAESLTDAGYETLAYDTNAARLDVAADRGAEPTVSPDELAGRIDAAVLALPGSPEVEALLLKGPFLDRFDGTLVVDATTTHPETGVRCAERCAEVGVAYVAAPFTRGAPRDGLFMCVGATEAEYERTGPLLDVLSTEHRRIGSVGAGRRFKLALQLRYALRSAVDAEVVAFARETGVDPALLNEFLGMDVSERYLEGEYATDEYGMGGLGIWHKDLGYALDVAREDDIPLPLTSSGHELYKAGRHAAGPGENCAEAVMRYWERLRSEAGSEKR